MANVNWNSVEQEFDKFLEANGSPCRFELADSKLTFTIKGGLRMQAEEPISAGINQEHRKLSVMAKRWKTAAPPGRDPQKGDRVTVDSHRFAIMEADPAVAGGVRIGWRLRLRG